MVTVKTSSRSRHNGWSKCIAEPGSKSGNTSHSRCDINFLSIKLHQPHLHQPWIDVIHSFIQASVQQLVELCYSLTTLHAQRKTSPFIPASVSSCSKPAWAPGAETPSDAGSRPLDTVMLHTPVCALMLIAVKPFSSTSADFPSPVVQDWPPDVSEGPARAIP